MVDQPPPLLSGGLKWLAAKMKVDLPPLPPSSTVEFTTIKDFMMRYPQPVTKDIEEVFLQKSNSKTLFPKLILVIRPAIKIWTINQRIKLLGLRTKAGFKRLKSDLRTNVSLPPAHRLHFTQALQHRERQHNHQAPCQPTNDSRNIVQ